MTDWNEHEDAIDDVISDSIDMDWTSRTGARAVVAWLNENAAAPAPSSLAGGWRSPTEVPEAKKGEHAYRIVAVKRADGEKVVTFSAFYMNAVPLWFEDDNESRNVTGWHSDSEGDDGPTHSPLLMGGDVLMGWREFPQWEAALSPEAPARETEGRAAILKGVGKIDGDGWKDTTRKGEVVFVWNAEKPSPYAPGQYPRIGNEGWSASTSQYDFAPATVQEVRDLFAALNPRHESPAEGAGEREEIPLNARELFRSHCKPGTYGSLERHGERAAIATIMEATSIQRDKLAELLRAELADSYDCSRVWSAWGYGTMGEDDFTPVGNRVDEMAGGIVSVISPALRARSSAPEAREGEAVGYVAADAEAALRAGMNRAIYPARTVHATLPLYTHPAAPSADKLRIAVEALEPFANLGVSSGPDDEPCHYAYRITRGAIRNARQAIATLKAEAK